MVDAGKEECNCLQGNPESVSKWIYQIYTPVPSQCAASSMQRDDKRRKMADALKPTGAFTIYKFLRKVYGSFYAPAILRRLSSP